MGVHTAWEQYEKWNRVIAGVLFTPANEGRPVYLDMDDDVLAEIAGAAGVAQDDVAPRLVASVRSTLNFDADDGPVFERHLQKLRQWRRTLYQLRLGVRQPGPPPVLGLLSALTLAAEAMGDTQFASNAYYPRLLELLEVPARATARMRSGYRENAEELWLGLNDWLTAMDGRLGLPTAYAATSRYVGLPVSQALVRSADRGQFPVLFQRYGLPAGGEISPEDMAILLDDWIGQVPCPVSRGLQNLWRRGQARERISSVAAIELRNWDGAARGTIGAGTRASGAVRLVCLLTRFPRPRLQMSFVSSAGAQSAELSALTVLSAPGHPAVDVVPVPGSRVQPAPGSHFDAAQLLEGFLQLELPGSVTLSRFPRRIIPFRKDDLLSTFVESDRVQLGDEALVLIRNDSGLLDKALALIEETARPGFRVETSIPGMPDGWTLISGVQIAVHTKAGLPGGDLNALVPILSSQLTITGGAKLPGRMRKWSSLDPPEILATAHGASLISLTMAVADSSRPVRGLPRTWTSTTGTLLAELRDVCLGDGDFDLTLARDSALIQQAVLRLRSSDTPDAAYGQGQPFVHALDHDRLCALRAAAEPEALDGRLVLGPVLPSAPGTGKAADVIPAGIWWARPKPAPSVADTAPALLTNRDPKSCAMTGAHRYVLPTFYGHKQERERARLEGRKRTAVIEGACEVCGFVKPFPAFIPRWQERKEVSDQDLSLQVAGLSDLPPVKNPGRDWAVAIDNVMHAGGGGYRSLEYIARQVDDSAMFAATFAQALETRGDVEIRRDRDLKPLEWAATPPSVAELTTGRFMLVGRWTRKALIDLAILSAREGGTFEEPLDPAGAPVYAVCGLSAEQVAKIAAEVGVHSVVRHAASAIAACLPPLSQALAALHRMPMPVTRRIERYHLESSSWVRTGTAIAPGAYRLETNFTTTYLVRTADDIAAGTAAVAASHLAKHLAALLAGRPLIAYNPDKRAFFVPVGADLPGLYGRAAVLCSGQQPKPAPKYRTQTYRSVPPSVAGQLTRALTS